MEAIINLWPALVGLIAAGAVSGLFVGILGVGGGIVLVPVLFSVLGLLGVPQSVCMHLAVGTSFAILIPTAASSARAHFRKDSVSTDILKYWGPMAFLGCVFGVFVAGRVSGAVLGLVFAAGALTVGLVMLISPEKPNPSRRMPGPAIAGVVSGTVGVISAMMGIGGGTFFVPLFTALGTPVHLAVGTSTALGVVVAIPGLAGYLWSSWSQPALPGISFGYAVLLGAVVIAPVSSLCAPFGTKFAHSLPPRILKMAFGIFLVATAVRMAVAIL